MKIFCLMVLFAITVFPQTMDPAINDLYSAEPNVVLAAMKAVRDQQNTDALPHMHKIIADQPPYIQLRLVKLMVDMGDSFAAQEIHTIIDKADTFSKHKVYFEPLEAKVDATQQLIRLGDYSTVQFVFDNLRREKPKIYSTSFLVLPEILKSVPEFRDKAKEELLYILNNNKESYYRSNSMDALAGYYRNEMIPEIIKAVDDEDQNIRMQALTYLKQFNYPELKQLLLDRRKTENNGVVKGKIEEMLGEIN